MRHLLMAGAAVLALSAGAAHAEVLGRATFGSWTTFGGTTSAGERVCGMGVSGDPTFVIRSFETYFQAGIGRENWQMDAGYKTTVSFEIDGWTATYTAHTTPPNFIVFTLPAGGPAGFKAFLDHIEQGTSVAKWYYGNNASGRDWVRLNGSADALRDVGTCWRSYFGSPPS